MSKRPNVLPLEALNPYTSGWTIRVRATSKGPLRSVKTARGDSTVFSVDLTDEQARQRVPGAAADLKELPDSPPLLPGLHRARNSVEGRRGEPAQAV
jgi:hypothetical protein